MNENREKNPFKFWEELKRRRVIGVIIVYAAAAYVILELTSIIAEPFGLPEWTLKLVFILLCAGLIISIVLSWIYDITPQGVEKTKPSSVKDRMPGTRNASNIIGWKIATYISLLIIASLLVFNIIRGRDSKEYSDLEKTIAILPFDNLGPPGTNSVLEHALPIAIMMRLQDINVFKIRPWTSTKRYIETALSGPEIGRQLNVNYLVKGYIQQKDNEVIVDIMLVHAGEDEIIGKWTENLKTDDLIEVQNSISNNVSSALKYKFSPEKEAPTDNPDALYAYTTGMKYYWNEETESDFLQALKYLEKAVELDPDFVLAYAKLSSTSSWLYHFHFDRTEERLEEARRVLEKAKTINPESPDLKISEGIYYYVTHEYEKALEKLKQAGDLVYDKVELNVSLASLYRRQLKLDKALEYFTRALEQDPQNIITINELAETNLLLGNYEEAENYYNRKKLLGQESSMMLVNSVYLNMLREEGTTKSREALRDLIDNENGLNITLAHQLILLDIIDGMYSEAVVVLDDLDEDVFDHQFIYMPKSMYYAEIYRQSGDRERAAAYYDSSLVILKEKLTGSLDDSRLHSTLGIAYAGLGIKDEAVAEGLKGVDLMPLSKDYYRGIFREEDLARIYTMVGEYDLALEQLDRLLSMPGLMSVSLLKKDPVWKPLWDRHGFTELIKKHTDK
ncbi:MAG: tetratricopeptide repeat protein [Bacteroidales bacterium]|jgi:tetratricopeptide (TPR) repeat protein|nr:tetratricopeptide repeat protein [Bacteroidales bacterium]